MSLDEEQNDNDRMVSLNCRGEIITIPLYLAKEFPTIKASLNFKRSTYFINHKASDVHSFLDSIAMPIENEFGYIKSYKKITPDDIILMNDVHKILVIIDDEFNYVLNITRSELNVGNYNSICTFSLENFNIQKTDKNINKIVRKVAEHCPYKLFTQLNTKVLDEKRCKNVLCELINSLDSFEPLDSDNKSE